MIVMGVVTFDHLVERFEARSREAHRQHYPSRQYRRCLEQTCIKDRELLAQLRGLSYQRYVKDATS